MREIRAFPCEMEVRAEEGARPVIFGYAARFEELSEPLHGFREKIAKGAFADSIATRDVLMLWNHRADYPLASTQAGSMTLSEDEIGLRFEAEMPDTTWGRDAYESVKSRIVRGVSFGFKVAPQGQRWSGGVKNTIRTLLKVDLLEISPTPFPAYRQTSVATRAEGEGDAERRAYQDYLAQTHSEARDEMRRRALRIAELEGGV